MKSKTRYKSNRSFMKRLSGLALAAGAALVFSLNVQAQDCTIENWSGSVGLVNADAGNQGANNRRYAGPCGLRVAIDGQERYMIDASPDGESTYNARFYVFLDQANVGSEPLLIFAALDGSEDVIQVWHTGNDLLLTAFQSDGTSDSSEFTNVGSGWHSVELVWSSGANVDVGFSVNGATDAVLNIDTSGLGINEVHLGNVNGIDTGGHLDFDAFDSRRESRPGRLCRGLTDETRDELAFQDAINIFGDAVSPSTNAQGTPDYDEDGEVTFTDAILVFERAVSPSLRSCAENR